MRSTWKLAEMAIALASVAIAQPVWAQCVTGTPGARTPVTCDGNSSAGFDAPAGTDDIDVAVNAGATVKDGNGSGAAVRLNAKSTVSNAGSVTAEASDGRAIEVGDNATVDNLATGAIHGGPDGAGNTGYAVWFRGSAVDASNTLGNDGLIDTQGAVAIKGSAGSEQLTLRDGSSVIGDIELDGGDDQVIVRGSANVTGRIDLGATSAAVDASNLLRLEVGASLAGDIVGGPDDDELEVFRDAVLTGDVALGDGDDLITIGSDASIVGAIDLGAGANAITTFVGAILTGNVSAGSGDDSVQLDGQSVLTGALDLGAGNDSLELAADATLNGSVDMGAGADTVVYGVGATVSGSLALGAGDDVFKLRRGAAIPSGLDSGAGVDTLQLDAAANPTVLVGSIDLFTANNKFEALLIGAGAPGDPADVWVISTSQQTTFSDDIELQSGSLQFEGVVDLVAGFTQKPDATMVFELGQATPDSMLDLTGALVLDAGATAQVTIDGSIIEGDFALISTTGGITGSFAEVTLPDLASFAFSTALGANDLVLTATRTRTYDDFARTPSERLLGEHLDAARLTAGPGAFTAVAEALDLLSASGLATALAQLNAESYDAHTSSVLSWGRLQQRVLQQRPMRCEQFRLGTQPEVASESPCGARGFMPWARVVGGLGRHKGGEPSGYDARGAGLILGVDHRFDENFSFSGDIGFGHVRVEHDNGADGEFDSIDVGLAMGVVVGPLSARSSVTYSHAYHESTRSIDFLGDQVRGHFTSDRVSVMLGAGYEIPLGYFIVEPNATVDYTHVGEESIEEEGNGVVALDIRPRGSDVIVATAGLRLHTNSLKYGYAGDLLEWADGVWTPLLSVQWRQSFGDIDRELTAEMRGTPAALGRLEVFAGDSRGGVEVGGQIRFQPLNSVATVEIGYEGYFGDDVINHTANATLRIPF